MQVVEEMRNANDKYWVLGVSTAHVLQEDMERLRELAESGVCNMVLSRDTGGFVKLYPDDGEPRVLEVDYPGFSAHFYNVLAKVKAAGFAMVEFDQDAAEYDLLPIFEW